MDTNFQQVSASPRPDQYRRHSLEFKRTLVELSLLPGASVARIAREHGVNANQVFSWRKLHQEGRLRAESAQDGVTLLPVALAKPEAASGDRRCGSSLLLEIGQARLHIEGSPDPTTLAQVLDRMMR